MMSNATKSFIILATRLNVLVILIEQNYFQIYIYSYIFR